jgi:MFS family permease
MYLRFCLYSVLKNLRFFEPFFVLYLLAPASQGGANLSYLAIGTLVGYQKFLTGVLEIPLGVATDRFGRRRALVLCFTFYTLAFPTYALASRLQGGRLLVMLYLAQTLFGLAEALRTGSHKAIMLDWASRSPDALGATALIGRTRFYSKAASGLAALCGGLMVWRSTSFTPLFWAATLPAGLGVLLMLSYPHWLEGEGRQTDRRREDLAEGLRRLVRRPGLVPLVLASLLFESQIKLAQHYLQPFLSSALHRREVVLVGGIGAMVVGLFYLGQGLVGGFAARLAPHAEESLGDAQRGLRLMYLVLCALSAAMALAFGVGWLVAGLLGYFLMTVLQNLRRPVFIARLDHFMDPAQRATTLSFESQARSWMLALFSPPIGYLADRFGISAAFVAITALLVLGIPLHLARGQRIKASETEL